MFLVWNSYFYFNRLQVSSCSMIDSLELMELAYVVSATSIAYGMWTYDDVSE